VNWKKQAVVWKGCGVAYVEGKWGGETVAGVLHLHDHHLAVLEVAYSLELVDRVLVVPHEEEANKQTWRTNAPTVRVKHSLK
jgi:hypothetical protein